MRKLAYILFILFVSGLQQTAAQKAIKKQADQYYKVENYREALRLYRQLGNSITKDKEVIVHKAIAYYYCNFPDSCLELLKIALVKEPLNEELYFYSARSLQDLGSYVEAAAAYKNVLRTTKSQATRIIAINEIKKCEASRKLVYLDQMAYAENMGDKVNTPFDEINPVQSPNYQNKFYFSSNRDISVGGPRDEKGLTNELVGKYRYDMFAVELQKGEWAQIFPFTALQNTTNNEIIEDFSKDGIAMYYMKSEKEMKGHLYVDSFDLSVEKRAFPPQVTSDYRCELGDKDLFIFSDSLFLFASNRRGGYGGYDLYAMLGQDGKWAQAVNLGPAVNSINDDVSPFLTKGGNQLYFSSDRINSLGGYDLFHCQFELNTGQWSSVKNLGPPINSTKNDIDPLVSSDGNQLVFASDRIGGFGGYDLQMAYLKTQVTDQISYAETPSFIEYMLESPDAFTMNADSISVSNEQTVEKKIFHVSNLYYTGDENLLGPQNTTIINNLADMMTVYPEMKLKFFGHGNIDNQPSFSLFLSMKRVEKIIETLVKKGIAKDRFDAVAFGPSYPMVNINAQDKYNNRIEVKVTNFDANILTVEHEKPKINESVKSDVYDTYLNSFYGLYYRIKIATTSQVLKYEPLNVSPDLMIERNSDGTYNYYMTLHHDLRSARLQKNEILQQGSSQATIVPFYNGKKLSPEDVQRMVSSLPQLKDYMDLNEK